MQFVFLYVLLMRSNYLFYYKERCDGKRGKRNVIATNVIILEKVSRETMSSDLIFVLDYIGVDLV